MASSSSSSPLLSLTPHRLRLMEHDHVGSTMCLLVGGCALPFIAGVNVPHPSVLPGYFGVIYPSSLVSSLPPFPPLSSFPLFIFVFVFLFFSSFPRPPARRRLTSVSWARRRRLTPTVCSADRWGPFTCSPRRSAPLRSWPSISWARATRLGGLIRPNCYILKRPVTTCTGK